MINYQNQLISIKSMLMSYYHSSFLESKQDKIDFKHFQVTMLKSDIVSLVNPHEIRELSKRFAGMLIRATNLAERILENPKVESFLTPKDSYLKLRETNQKTENFLTPKVSNLISYGKNCKKNSFLSINVSNVKSYEENRKSDRFLVPKASNSNVHKRKGTRRLSSFQ